MSRTTDLLGIAAWALLCKLTKETISKQFPYPDANAPLNCLVELPLHEASGCIFNCIIMLSACKPLLHCCKKLLCLSSHAEQTQLKAQPVNALAVLCSLVQNCRFIPQALVCVKVLQVLRMQGVLVHVS